ncbi:MAG: peptidoglycan-binding domain-containing protein [Actinomycetota bacterium]
MLEVDGDFGPQTVKALQWSLDNTGASPTLAVDGDFGAKSRRALQARLNHVAARLPSTAGSASRRSGLCSATWGPIRTVCGRSGTTKALQANLNDGTF